MLVFELTSIGDKLYRVRKRLGYTQAEVAEAAEISTRAYAEIERGCVNMRIETLLKLCNVLHITPDELFVTEDNYISAKQSEILERLNACAPKDKETALKILSVFFESLN